MTMTRRNILVKGSMLTAATSIAPLHGVPTPSSWAVCLIHQAISMVTANP